MTRSLIDSWQLLPAMTTYDEIVILIVAFKVLLKYVYNTRYLRLLVNNIGQEKR